MTNQTTVFSAVDVDSSTGIANVTNLVNHFIISGTALGYINFDILPLNVQTDFHSGVALEKNWYTVQVNYYDPAVYS